MGHTRTVIQVPWHSNSVNQLYRTSPLREKPEDGRKFLSFFVSVNEGSQGQRISNALEVLFFFHGTVWVFKNWAY